MQHLLAQKNHDSLQMLYMGDMRATRSQTSQYGHSLLMVIGMVDGFVLITFSDSHLFLAGKAVTCSK